MKLKNIALIAALITLVSGCEQFDQFNEKFMGKKEATPASEPVDAVATVNGEAISVDIFNSYARARAQQQQGVDIDKHRGAIINEMINRQLLVQEAIKNGLDKQPQISAEIQNQQENILSTVMMRHYLSQNEITDEMLKQEYDDFIKNTNFDEYQISYIMVKTKEEAEDIAKKLDAGANFAEMAKEKSLDPNGKQGGSLGWITPTRLPAPFAKMLGTLKKGEHGIMSEPNGQHIFRMDDIRTQDAPSFEDSKKGMVAKIHKRKLDNYINELKATAKIEIRKTEETPAPSTEAPAETPAEAPAATN
ncbi:MAG: peptidylprolyl isomerase [Gammaproteobacteria bacterium]|nr:peptidylprolyl isomerase [Gammaproteobacteria bacterium]MDH5593047.1 peptidylprolyl isomerase [Gammaproteobacteria bacterium]